jgi:hypothetical protein|tara:strand:- start:1063 stop:1281 length:219 start_codon:yes stop_codon:yes gene_type:complete
MENDHQDNLKQNHMIAKSKSKTVEIELDLLKDLRNVFEVMNERIHWKTSELLPVGILLKRLDDILTNNSNLK